MRLNELAEFLERQCQSRNNPGFHPSIFRYSRIRGAADETVLNIVHKQPKNPVKKGFEVAKFVRKYETLLEFVSFL